MVHIDDLKERFPMISAVVEVARDGSPLSSHIPHNVHLETFAIMCATIMGAAGTASSEIGEKTPKSIIVEGPEKTIIIAPNGDNRIIACAVEDPQEVPLIIAYIIEKK